MEDKDKMFEVTYKPGEEFTLRVHLPRTGGLSAEVRGHARQAGKEALLTLRSFLDEVIQALDEKEKGEKKRRRTRIEVQ